MSYSFGLQGLVGRCTDLLRDPLRLAHLAQDRPSPFELQELIDHCISFLRDSPPDLKACALVSRRWVYPAQSHLFRTINITIGGPATLENVWTRLKETRLESRHLIRHFRRLHIEMPQFEVNLMQYECRMVMFAEICDFPFTHLDYVRIICCGHIRMLHALALQQLLSVPSIREVTFQGDFGADSSGLFLTIFGRCSRAVRHLHLHPIGDRAMPFAYSDTPATIPLTSLNIASLSTRRPRPALWVFTVSRLKALSISGFIDWARLAPAMDTIEVLSLHIQPGSASEVDLSAFPNLSLLRISCVHASRNIVDSLRGIVSTIPPTHRIHTIVIPVRLSDWELCAIFDDTLSPLQLSVVEVEVADRGHAAQAADCFPRLRTKGLLRVKELRLDWWENIVRAL
ncbi:hypothetical protein C8R47DRAFT_1145304 [Mycena vitilis]|nr:hypothetical protein C8R47DRAFT_1145304 [Mycena vitilis]